MGSFYKVSKVDEFIRKLNSGAYKISPDAYKKQEGEHRSVGESLYEAINNYETFSSGTSGTLDNYHAQICLNRINEAFGKGLVLDNSDLMNKLQEKDEHIIELEKEVKRYKEMATQLGKDLLQEQGRYDELEKRMKSMFKNQDESYGK